MESERLRNSLLAAMSHDLRTPLTALIGAGGIARAEPAAAQPAQRDTGARHRATKRCA